LGSAIGSPPTPSDLSSIWDHTHERWNFRRAETYIREIKDGHRADRRRRAARSPDRDQPPDGDV